MRSEMEDEMEEGELPEEGELDDNDDASTSMKDKKQSKTSKGASESAQTSGIEKLQNSKAHGTCLSWRAVERRQMLNEIQNDTQCSAAAETPASHLCSTPTRLK